MSLAGLARTLGVVMSILAVLAVSIVVVAAPSTSSPNGGNGLGPAAEAEGEKGEGERVREDVNKSFAGYNWDWGCICGWIIILDGHESIDRLGSRATAM
mmetsp:Transcript_4002/g.8513  ORF Transcript_4002/g.8513 Transcript_4002/m.8513 type:complete len:99 (+) Transcript_4002:416-712(+)